MSTVSNFVSTMSAPTRIICACSWSSHFFVSRTPSSLTFSCFSSAEARQACRYCFSRPHFLMKSRNRLLATRRHADESTALAPSEPTRRKFSRVMSYFIFEAACWRTLLNCGSPSASCSWPQQSLSFSVNSSCCFHVFCFVGRCRLDTFSRSHVSRTVTCPEFSSFTADSEAKMPRLGRESQILAIMPPSGMLLTSNEPWPHRSSAPTVSWSITTNSSVCSPLYVRVPWWSKVGFGPAFHWIGVWNRLKFPSLTMQYGSSLSKKESPARLSAFSR
mmetsp:Transcript_96321/g.250984  ORF Transcript_96321/g.250984 Transcript_96321/m.250984 type:complete len:275 (-) Transcript_96321:1178-2002(-)